MSCPPNVGQMANNLLCIFGHLHVECEKIIVLDEFTFPFREEINEETVDSILILVWPSVAFIRTEKIPFIAESNEGTKKSGTKEKSFDTIKNIEIMKMKIVLLSKIAEEALNETTMSGWLEEMHMSG